MSEASLTPVFVNVDRLRELQRLAWHGTAKPEQKTPESANCVHTDLATSQVQEGIPSEVRVPAIKVVHPNNSNWESFMACKGKTALFFPPMYNEKKDRRLMREAKAKAICASCQVTQFCLEKALLGEEKGIWGGTNEGERKTMILRRKN